MSKYEVILYWSKEDDVYVAEVPQLVRRFERYFLTQKKEARKKAPSFAKADHYPSPAAKKRHDAALVAVAPGVSDAIMRLERDVEARDVFDRLLAYVYRVRGRREAAAGSRNDNR